MIRPKKSSSRFPPLDIIQLRKTDKKNVTVESHKASKGPIDNLIDGYNGLKQQMKQLQEQVDGIATSNERIIHQNNQIIEMILARKRKIGENEDEENSNDTNEKRKRLRPPSAPQNGDDIE